MRRLVAHGAEIVGGGHDAHAQVMLPQAIDDDAAGQRMIGPAQPAGRDRASSGRARAGCAGADVGGSDQTFREARLHALARLADSCRPPADGSAGGSPSISVTPIATGSGSGLSRRRPRSSSATPRRSPAVPSASRRCGRLRPSIDLLARPAPPSAAAAASASPLASSWPSGSPRRTCTSTSVEDLLAGLRPAGRRTARAESRVVASSHFGQLLLIAAPFRRRRQRQIVALHQRREERLQAE